MKKTILRSYAKLIARTGVNIEKGQEVMILAGLDQPEFVKMLVEECYRAGAGKVIVDWEYQPLEKLHVRHQSVKTLGHVEKWEEEKFQHYIDVLPCRIYLDSEDPDGLKGVNIQKMAKGRQGRYKVLKPYRDQMEGRYQWCIAAVPGKAWAKKVFPDVSPARAVEKLWEVILQCSRVTDDPMQAWRDHNADLEAKCKYLNDLGVKELRYRAGNGTDFSVGMIPQAEWRGGGETSLTGHFFNPNIPSEEVFISPMRGKAEGIVYASMPLSYEGQLIENFSVRFEGGKVVEVKAEKGEELLRQMVGMDEGAAYLGECALVPYDSPIRNSGILFYNTLFDENAACHLALGRGFIDSIKDYGNYSLEECHEMGINESMIHVDFMIGTEDMEIDAIDKDGNVVPVFRNGNWAI
ncbi:MAG: aminopeptidase [Clostridia bacterium]|nr:aminopeptidase [Clostridia bacterium]